jgi:THO complex subunit 2
VQQDHCCHILSDLEAKRISFLSAVVEDQRRPISEALLQHCIMPRVTITPEDSLFCAKFIQKLHILETPNFSSLQYFDRVIKDIFPIVFCATDHEARCLGIFLRATFKPLKDWRFNKHLFDVEAASKPGFSVAIGSPSRCSYDQYCTVFFKWYDKITKIMISCLEQYRDHGRACLLVLIKLIGVYPVRKRVGAILMEKLSALKNQEDLKDVQAMAQRYHTLLSKYRVDLHDDLSSKRDGPKIPNTTVPGKRQASASTKPPVLDST